MKLLLCYIKCSGMNPFIVTLDKYSIRIIQ